MLSHAKRVSGSVSRCYCLESGGEGVFVTSQCQHIGDNKVSRCDVRLSAGVGREKSVRAVRSGVSYSVEEGISLSVVSAGVRRCQEGIRRVLDIRGSPLMGV